MKNQKNKKEEEIAELVIARLETLPSDVQISIGSQGSFNKEQLINHVKENDEIGKKIIEVELEYLRLLKKGIFYEQPDSRNPASV